MLNLNRDEPECFKSFKMKNKPHSYGDDCDDYNLRECLRTALLVEQKRQCFYCEKRIENNSHKVHIDHIKQRTHYPKLECKYSNMALSCNSEKHCGTYKDKQGRWEDDKFIRILSENQELEEKPSDLFCFVSNGDIKVKRSLSEDEKIRGQKSIEYLNLNNIDLVGMRKSIFYKLENYKKSGYQIDNIFTFFNEFESIFKET